MDRLLERRLVRLRQWARLLDSAFRVPGTRLRFGWDPVLGLVPGVGDLIAPAYAVVIIVTAVQLGIPRVVLLRMLLTAAIDAVIGVVPVVGDLFDFAWRANHRNMVLLERYARGPRTATAADWLFVLGILSGLAVVALVPLVALVLLVRWMTTVLG